jgi:hypothetical protein
MATFIKSAGTTNATYQIGPFGGNYTVLTNNAASAALEVRNQAGAFLITRGANGVATNDYVTFQQLTAASSTASVMEIRFAITTTAAQLSATSIPAASRMIDAEFVTSVPYSAGTTITIGQTGAPTQLQGTGDNNPQDVGVGDVFRTTGDFTSGIAAPVLVTVAGAPVVGSGFVVVRYVQTPNL